MPRDAAGEYTLPAGNPVVPNTTISNVWANQTLNDIAQALSLTLSVDGSVKVPKLAAEAVTTPKLAQGAVTDDKLPTSVVSTDKLDAEAVTTPKLAAEAVTAPKLGAGVVQPKHLGGYNGNGYLYSVGDTFVPRTITNTVNQVTVSGGTGLSGNTQVGLPSDVRGINSVSGLGSIAGAPINLEAAADLNLDGDILMGGYRALIPSRIVHDVVSSGANANGRWIKFACGTMICYAKIDISFSMSGGMNPYGGWWWTYPAAFVALPTILRQIFSSDNYAGVTEYSPGTLTVSSFLVYLPSSAGTGLANIGNIAIGRWK